MPAAWHTVRVPANNTASGGGCGQPYLLTDRRGDANDCVLQTVYATVEPARSGSLVGALGAEGGAAIAGGTLPAAPGMRGAWAQVKGGSAPAYPVYAVSAAYESHDRRVLYALTVRPPLVESHCPEGSASLARGIARALARSFRVEVTDPATAEALSS